MRLALAALLLCGCAGGTLQRTGTALNVIRPALIEACKGDAPPKGCDDAIDAFNDLAAVYGIANAVGAP